MSTNKRAAPQAERRAGALAGYTRAAMSKQPEGNVAPVDLPPREEIMRQWDSWRKYIANGGCASWPRDAFESLLDAYDEALADAPASETNEPRPCCGEYLDCERPCVPRGRMEVQYAVSSWLGCWRDKMPSEAVTVLQDILDVQHSETNVDNLQSEIRRLKSALIHHAASLVNMNIVEINPDIEYLRRYDVMTVAIRMRESATPPKTNAAATQDVVANSISV